jgi:uncharacterized protein YbjT (DUF2867 family)
MSPKTILFLGATGGVAFSTLRRSLAANHTCIALCRTPATLLTKLNLPTAPPNLHIHQGNAHDVDALIHCLLLGAGAGASSGPARLPDVIISSIGARPTLRGIMDNPGVVCQRGMAALLSALQRCRAEKNATGTPHIVAVSSTGIADRGPRDLPLLMVPLYHVLLATPHKDKRAMEGLVMGSGEVWTLVRGSLYTSGEEAAEGMVRVGMSDPVTGVVESQAVGYTISREDVGKWIYDELVQGKEAGRWVGKAATITY